ncbi:MAG: tRNA 2-thiocytidine(32) synthetase TtcA [Candidatus Omnitrophica bacterium]|nr:tRNA 2-thiocytidine(32) synthetase TtcA [Candidatus Omnitrophota bacterium]
MNKTGYFISKLVGKAICDYGMIEHGDRVMVAVSGGKDSLCLVDMLRDRQRRAPIMFDIFPVHYNADDTNAAVVAAHLRARDYDYRIIPRSPQPPIQTKSPCFNCTRERRDRLFAEAQSMQCRKIAFAHHQDDIIQTVLLNLFFVGEISTMPPRLELSERGLVIIRPLALVDEAAITRYARVEKYPALPNVCPHAGKTNRQRMADIIQSVETICPHARTNIYRALQRVKTGYLT